MTLVPGSTPQSSDIGTAFANPLALAITANNPVEPVNGGVIRFVPQPAADGATAIFYHDTAVVTDGQASIVAAPNNVAGTYYRRPRHRGRRRLRTDQHRHPVSPLAVNTTSDDIAPGAGLLSLREAVAFDNSDPGPPAAISFDPQYFAAPRSIALAGQQLEQSDTSGPWSIEGPAGGVTVDAGGLSRVFQVDGGVTASLSGLTITGGDTGVYPYVGGGLNNEGGAVTLTGCTVSGNSAVGQGGGVYSNGGTITLTDCTISGNHRRFSRPLNLPNRHPTVEVGTAGFSPGFQPFFGSRLGCRLGKPATNSRSPALRFTRRPATSSLAEPPHFLPFSRPALPLPPGPNGSQGVPRGRLTCLIDTQLPWLAPWISRASSGSPSRQPTAASRSAAPTSSNPRPPTTSPGGSSSTGIPFGRSSATSPGTPTSTPSSRPPGPGPRRRRSAMGSDTEPASSAAKGPPCPSSAPPSSEKAST